MDGSVRKSVRQYFSFYSLFINTEEKSLFMDSLIHPLVILCEIHGGVREDMMFYGKEILGRNTCSLYFWSQGIDVSKLVS